MPPRLALGDNERKMILAVLDYYRERDLDPGYEGHFEKIYCRAFAEMMGGGYADAVANRNISTIRRSSSASICPKAVKCWSHPSPIRAVWRRSYSMGSSHG